MPTRPSRPARSHSDYKAVLAGKSRHALLHGDCLDLLRLMPDQCVDAVISDPPYGIAYCGESYQQKPIANDQHPFIWWLFDAARVLKDGGALLCFCPWRKQAEFKLAIETAGLKLRNHLIWDCKVRGMGGTHCTAAHQHDIIWFATKGKFRFEQGTPASVFAFANIPAIHRDHTTQKPDDLMQQLVEKFSPAGGVVLDPCMGSGSTVVAALATGRRGIGIELDNENYAIACRRCSQAMLPNKFKTKGKSMPMREIRIGSEVLCCA